MEYYEKISLNSIDKIEVYINSSSLTLSQIVKKTKCDYAITGVFYNTQWKPTCQLKKDNRVLVDDGYKYWGAAWNNGADIVLAHVPDLSKNYSNHYACLALIKDGKGLSNLQYNKDVSGYRGRTAIGVSGNDFVIYASKDGTNDSKTPEGLRDYILAKDKNIKWMIMGDGGGKVNYYGQGNLMQGSAKSQNLILVYLKKDTPYSPTTEQLKESNQMIEGKYSIIEKLMTNNGRYVNQIPKTKIGYMQHSTAMPNVKAKTIIANWNKLSASAETEFIIDDTGIYQIMPLNIKTWHCGGNANNTHVGCEICEPEDSRFLDGVWANLSLNGKDNTTFAVKALQTELKAWGYDPNGIDGVFGNGTRNAVIAFQTANGLTADGVVGLGTLHTLQKRKGSVMVYNAEKNREYFEDVYNKAVYTCAYVLSKLNINSINKSNVLSHAEGYKAGVASNHGDVEHWFPKHGKTMDDFRNDVEVYLEGGKLPFGSGDAQSTATSTTIHEIDLAWDKCCDKGIFDGSNPDNPITRKQMAVVLYRLGLIK